jgi:hypothetical protein
MPDPFDYGHVPKADQRLVRALEHPVRVGLLKLLAERGALRAGEALSLLDRPGLVLASVAYHVRVLSLLGLVEPIEAPPPGAGPAFAATSAGEDAAAALGLPRRDENGG